MQETSVETARSEFAENLERDFLSYDERSDSNTAFIFSPTNLNLLQAAADFLAINTSFVIGYFIFRKGELLTYLDISVFFSIVALIVFKMYNLYSRQSSILNIQETKNLFKGLSLITMGLFAAIFYFKAEHISRGIITTAIAVTFIVVSLERRMSNYYLERFCQTIGTQTRVLVYGSGEVGRYLVKQMVQSPRLGFLPVGFVDDDPLNWGKMITYTHPVKTEVPILGGGESLNFLARNFNIAEVIIALPTLPSKLINDIILHCERHDLKFRVVPNLYNLHVHKAKFTDVNNIPLLSINEVENDTVFLVLKRAIDIVLSLFVLTMLSPLLIATAVLIKREDRGPVFFSQERVGLNGSIFRMYKFRSMRMDAPAYHPSPKSEDDPRITRIGKWLRRTSLDELPQFFNVLKGEMSIVGPRPEMKFIVEGYNNIQNERLKIKPGITGLWQLSGDRNKPIHANIEYDLYYMQNRDLAMDLIIILETFFFAARGI